MTTAAYEAHRADLRADLGFPEMTCPGCDEPQNHANRCAECRNIALAKWGAFDANEPMDEVTS